MNPDVEVIMQKNDRLKELWEKGVVMMSEGYM